MRQRPNRGANRLRSDGPTRLPAPALATGKPDSGTPDRKIGPRAAVESADTDTDADRAPDLTPESAAADLPVDIADELKIANNDLEDAEQQLAERNKKLNNLNLQIKELDRQIAEAHARGDINTANELTAQRELLRMERDQLAATDAYGGYEVLSTPEPEVDSPNSDFQDLQRLIGEHDQNTELAAELLRQQQQAMRDIVSRM